MNGHLHPITQFNRLSLKYFQDLGFDIKEGNEIESEWYNFDALNVPADHPSRDVQDTFWLAPSKIEGLAPVKSTSEVAE
ncbi:MAG: phenylalanyl-tRNA synthetase subunit alpha, partial [uncultured bacterium]